MKKSLALLFSICMLQSHSQETKVWRFGAQLGMQGNHSTFAGGMQTANARFHHNDFGAGALSFVARFDVNRHWMVTGGLGLSSFGFEYAIAENYSLLNKDKQFSLIRSEFGVFEMPAMVFYKFNPNCRNSRWLVGAGIAQYLTGAATIEKGLSKASDMPTATDYISSTSQTRRGFLYFFRWSIAREKVFKSGSILNAAFLVNWGLSEIAKSTVHYTIDNVQYTHTFSNSGNFAGIRITYLFRPCKAGK
jgi:hypothetical protein